jgi:hypothetical protein
MNLKARALGSAVIVLLAGCGGGGEPGDDSSERPTASATDEATEPAGAFPYEAACEAIAAVIELPNDDAVGYAVSFRDPAGPASNLPICGIEPEGEYYDVAAEAGAFGRVGLDYGEIVSDRQDRPAYDPEAPEAVLTLDQSEHLTAEHLPCAVEPCEDGVHGYQYNFRFETVLDDIVVIAEFDYITTDTSGDQQDEYRGQAVAAFAASMDVIAAELD